MKGFQRFMRGLHAYRRVALASGMALLAGCASLQGVPLAPSTLPPLDGARQFRAVTCGEHADGRQSLVVVQPLGPTAWRWLQLDAFGAPRARQIIENGLWRNDGFLPPNPSASLLFAGLMTRLVPSGTMGSVFPLLQVQRQGETERFMQGNTLRWQIRTLGAAEPGWELMLPGAETWCIHPLSP